jgi:hypothetical protein
VPVVTFPGFVGGMGSLQSQNVNCEDTFNFYVESAVGTAKAPRWLAPTPGHAPFVVLDNAPVRALFAQNGRMFAVSGTSFYEVFSNQSTALRGSTVLNGQPATISSNGSNGHQLFVVSGGLGYIYDLSTNVISQITDPDFPASVKSGTFSDGYFITLVADSNQFNISALYDGEDWDALDVFQTSTVSDQTIALIESHRELFILGEQTSAVWQNTGDDPVYQPIGGVKIEQGCAAAWSAVNLDNTVYFLGQGVNGARSVFRFRGYTPERVSNYAVEYALHQYPRVDNALAWTYQDQGHSFYVLYLPTPPAHPEPHTFLVYDVAEDSWHRRALWNYVTDLGWEPHIGRCHCYAFNRHFVGARNSGAIYEMNLTTTTDTLVV